MEPLNKKAQLEQLWKEFLEQRPTNGQLFFVISEIRPLEKAAINQLWHHNPTTEELASIMVLDPSLAEAIQKLLNVRNQRDEVIQKILEEMKSLVEETEIEETETEET